MTRPSTGAVPQVAATLRPTRRRPSPAALRAMATCRWAPATSTGDRAAPAPDRGQARAPTRRRVLLRPVPVGGGLLLAAVLVVAGAGATADAPPAAGPTGPAPVAAVAGPTPMPPPAPTGVGAVRRTAWEVPPEPAPGARYAWPLQPPVVRTPFRAPAHRYGPGHRGVDLAGAPGQPIRAARAGSVVFAGPVAGRGVLSVQHDDGLRTTYAPVRAVVRAGARVDGGQVIGFLEPGLAGCPDAACLHWGARRGAVDYVDPLVLLRPPRVRLLPVPNPWPDAPVVLARAPLSRPPAPPAARAGAPPAASGAGTPATR